MWRAVLIALFLMTGCASSHHQTEVETKTTVVEHEVHEHHGHHGSDDAGSDILGGFLQGLVDLFFGSDD